MSEAGLRTKILIGAFGIGIDQGVPGVWGRGGDEGGAGVVIASTARDALYEVSSTVENMIKEK